MDIYGYFMDILWICYGYFMDILWICYGYFMDILWICNVRPIFRHLFGCPTARTPHLGWHRQHRVRRGGRRTVRQMRRVGGSLPLKVEVPGKDW